MCGVCVVYVLLFVCIVCMSVPVHYCCLLLFVPTHHCCWERIVIARWMPETTTVRQGCPGLGTRLLPDQFLIYGTPHTTVGELVLVQYCHRTTIFPHGLTHYCVSPTSFFRPGQNCPGLIQARLGAEGPLREEAAGFPSLLKAFHPEQRQLR